MTKDTTAIGNTAEDAATQYLEAKGFRIITRNHRTRYSELDIIAADRQFLLFVEVKYRKHANFGGGVGAITAGKMRRLRNAASVWLAEHEGHSDLQPRVDVITVQGDLTEPQVEHLENVSIDI